MTAKLIARLAPLMLTALLAGGGVWSVAQSDKREALARAQQVLDREHARRLAREIERRTAAEAVIARHRELARAADARAARAQARLAAALETIERTDIHDPSERQALLERLNRLGADAARLWNADGDHAADGDRDL